MEISIYLINISTMLSKIMTLEYHGFKFLANTDIGFILFCFKDLWQVEKTIDELFSLEIFLKTKNKLPIS